MIYETCRIGAQYDACFRQQIQSLSSANFGTFNQSLYSTTFLAMRGREQFCTGCMGGDHTYEECARHPSKTIPMFMPYRPTVSHDVDPCSRRDEPKHRRGACFRWNDSKSALTNMCAQGTLVTINDQGSLWISTTRKRSSCPHPTVVWILYCGIIRTLFFDFSPCVVFAG